MSDHASPTAIESKLEAFGISPKVVTSFLTGLFLTGLAAALAAITPETLVGLGPWALPVYAGIVAVTAFVAGYAKRDPVREVGQETVAQAKAATAPEYQAESIPPGIG